MNIEYEESKKSIEELFKKFNSSLNGLTKEYVELNRKKFGQNIIQEQKKESLLELFFNQFQNLAIYVLIVAALISFALGHIKDGIAISFAVLLSGIIGFIQEYKSEKAIEYLKKLSKTQVRTIREGSEKLVNNDELVVGDIVILDEGNKVPADIRIIQGKELYVNESTLTGESFPVEKSDKINSNNILYAGTLIQKGHCKGIIIAVGKDTLFGKIAKVVAEEKKDKTPLQKNLDELGTKIAYLIIFLLVIYLLYGLLIVKKDFFEILTLSIILAVAGISEGLPTVVAITLALGMQEIAKRKAIVKRMSTIEDLGCITCICTDKTGTLTMNSMEPKYIFVNNNLYDINQFKKAIKNIELYKERVLDNNIEQSNGIELLLRTISIVNNSKINEYGEELGDPTEIGLLKVFRKTDLNENNILKHFKIIHENKFDSERKRMSVIVSDSKTNKHIMYVKGASEIILSLCNSIRIDKKNYELNETKKQEILSQINKIESKGIRILSCAYKEIDPQKDSVEDENGLIYIGFVALYDPPRKEAKYAVEMAYQAGIKIYMITGDSKGTAENIAKEVGLKFKKSMSGYEFSKLDEKKKKEILKDNFIFYRVNPIEKYEIVSTLKELGEIVAVTGDGINDAPAIKKSDVGIVMGKTGADVTKEVASIILLDENFKTIVVAIEHGRKIFENILNFIRFQFTTTTNLLSTMFLCEILRLPTPLTPIQILFINIIMDGPPALSLGVEPATDDIMKKQPRDPKKPYISNEMIITIFSSALFMTGITLLTLTMVNSMGIFDNKEYVTFSFVLLVCFQLFNAFNCRSFEDSAFKNLTKNKTLLISVFLTFLILLLLIYVQELNDFVNTTPISTEYLIIAILISSIILIFEEIRKFILRRKLKY
ncbi:MAG: cation-transporting P-type ATPase [Candidatus Aenigmatarchaeota archaeon]